MIRSNIKGVVGRLRMLERELPAAVARAASPDKGGWLAILREEAEKVLLQKAREAGAGSALAHDYYTGMARRMARSLTVGVKGDGWSYLLRAQTDSSSGRIAEAGQIMEGRTTRVYASPAGEEVRRKRQEPLQGTADEEGRLEAARQGVLDWVREEKDKDSTDAGLSDEEITDRLLYILGIHSKHNPREYTGAMREAASGLIPHIENFMDGQQVERGQGAVFPPALAGEWLRAVLAAWRRVLKLRMPAKIRREVFLLKRRLGEEMGMGA